MQAQEFLGKVCPYCKTPFSQLDDIVLCDRCEMPHHADCWIENQGCTTFGCDGTMLSSADESSNNHFLSESADDFDIELSPSRADSDLASSYCTKCGSVREPEDTFCRHCGNQHTAEIFTSPHIRNDYTQSSQSYGSSSVSDDRQILEGKFIGQNTEYYLPLFRKFQDQNKNTSWNWAAFILTPFWCIYRKMYGIGVGVFAAVILLNFLSYFGTVLVWTGRIIFGIFANYIYYKQISQKTDEYTRLQEAYATEYMNKNSGVSNGSVVFVVILYVTIIALTRL